MLIKYISPKTISSVICSFKPTTVSSVRFCSSRRDEFIESRINHEQLLVDKYKEPNGLCVLSLNNEKKRNVLSHSLVSLMENALTTLHNDRTIRCLIVRSTVDNIFCAGADLKERYEMDNHDVGPFVERLRNLANSLADLPYPVIAALDGVAFGGGLELALACDLRVGSPKVKLGLVETKLGIIPGAGGTQRLPRLIGLPAAKDLIFSGRKVDGKEAHSMRLIDYLTEDENDKEAAFKRSIKLAETFCTSAPLGVRGAKFSINKGSEVDLNTGMAIEKSSYDKIIWTKDRVEGMESFIQKRPPIFKGE